MPSRAVANSTVLAIQIRTFYRIDEWGGFWRCLGFHASPTNEAIARADPREIGSNKFNLAPALCSLMPFPNLLANDRHRDYSTSTAHDCCQRAESANAAEHRGTAEPVSLSEAVRVLAMRLGHE